MKKLILMAVAVMSMGVGVSFASNNDDNPNACHFKSGDNFYNGSVKTIERSWEDKQTGTKESGHNGGGKIGTSGTGANYNYNSNSSNSQSRSNITKTSSQECCTTNNECEDTYYKKGHRNDAVNAVRW